MPLQGKKVLVIDDAADARMLCKKLLERMGIQVTESGSVADAIDQMSKATPDLVILDLNMPNLSGFDFLSIRKSLSNFAAVPVIVSSGMKDAVAIHKAIGLGASDYLLKPLQPELMMHRLKKVFLNPNFSRYKFPEQLTPFLSLKTNDITSNLDAQTSIGVKLTEIDEIGMTVISRSLIVAGSTFTVTGDSVKSITGLKSFEANSISVSLNPQLEAYSVSLQFDPSQESLRAEVKDYIDKRRVAATKS